MQSPQPPARTHGLYVGGVDVLLAPGTGGNRAGVLIDSIVVVESGPAGISSIDFVIQDPERVVNIARGDEVRYHDIARNKPIFLGMVQFAGRRPRSVGRSLVVKGIGIDVLLDWQTVPALTIPAGTEIGPAVQSIYAAATGLGRPLQVFASSLGNGEGSRGIGDLSGGAPATLAADVVLAGESLREAIRKTLAVTIGPGVAFGQPAGAVSGWCYVDMEAMLRVLFIGGAPAGHATLTLNDTVAGPIRAVEPYYAEDYAGVAAGVFVTGGNAAGTGLVMRGDGVPGPIASLSDSSILTTAARDAAGQSYLANNPTAVRSEARLEDVDWSTNIRPVSPVVITDAQLGLTSYTTWISAITKTYAPGAESWALELGGRRPSVARQVRRLTASARP